jgi:hypothetical protein
MKNILFLSMTLFLFCELTNGQDMLVLKEGDTIRCTVTKIDSNMIYFKMKYKNQPINLSLERNQISDLIVPVLPDDPTRMMCEKNIQKYSTIGLLSGVVLVFGGAMTIYGFSESFEVKNRMVIFRGDYDNTTSGIHKIVLGIPFLVAGAIFGKISMTKVHKYKKQLKNLYNLSINTDYNTFYKGITISYKF